MFRIFAHPDLFMMNFDNWDAEIEMLVEEMCKVAKENNVALEINQACLINDKIREYPNGNRYRYPYSKFWDVVKIVGNEVITNIDAQDPKAYQRDDIRQKILTFAKEKGIDITIDLKIKSCDLMEH